MSYAQSRSGRLRTLWKPCHERELERTGAFLKILLTAIDTGARPIECLKIYLHGLGTRGYTLNKLDSEANGIYAV